MSRSPASSAIPCVGRGETRISVTSVCARRRCHVEGYEASNSTLWRTGQNCTRERSRNGRRSHISRDVQECVVVVLDRGLLVALVVHFKSRKLRTRADGSPVDSRVIRSSLPAFYRLRAEGTNSEPVGQAVPPDAARWRPLLRNRSSGMSRSGAERLPKGNGRLNRRAKKSGRCDYPLTNRSLLSRSRSVIAELNAERGK